MRFHPVARLHALRCESSCDEAKKKTSSAFPSPYSQFGFGYTDEPQFITLIEDDLPRSGGQRAPKSTLVLPRGGARALRRWLEKAAPDLAAVTLDERVGRGREVGG